MKLLQLGWDLKGEPRIVALDREEYESQGEREALKKIAERNNLSGGVVTGLSAREVQIYNLVFPIMPEKESQEAIRYKLIQLKPFGADISRIEYGFLKSESQPAKRSTQQRFLVVCAPKDAVLRKISLFGELGLKVAAVELEPLALVNLSSFLAAKNPSIKDKLILWLDLGAMESSLAIERNGRPHFVRTISLASRNLTLQLKDALRVSAEEAEAAKRAAGLSYWSADRKIPALTDVSRDPGAKEDPAASVYNGLISSLENLIIDVEHSFKYFSYQITQSEITAFDRLILSGGGSKLKNLENFLSAGLGVPVDKADPFALFEMDDGLKNQKSGMLKQACDFGVCAGLAVSAKADPLYRVNLAPRVKKRPAEMLGELLKEKTVRAAASVLGIAFLFIFFQTGRAVFYNFNMAALNKQVKGAQAKLGRLQTEQLKLAKREAELSDRKNLLLSRLSLFEDSLQPPKGFSGALSGVASVLPEEIWITKLFYADKKLTISGSTVRTDLIMSLVDGLRASEYFSDASFNQTQKDPQSASYSFDIVVGIR